MTVLSPWRVDLKAREDFATLNKRLARETLRKLGERLRDGKITPAAFRAGVEKELKGSVVAAYRFQVARKLNDADLARVNGVLARQGPFLDGFMRDIDAKEPGDWLAARAESYAGAVREAENEGRFEATDDAVELTWSGPDGAESCDECAALIGETRTVAEWRASGERPGQTQCGDRCRCELNAA